MFVAFCSSCSKRELIFAGQVLGIDNTAGGIVVTFRCGHQHVGRWRTGRQAGSRPAAVTSA